MTKQIVEKIASPGSSLAVSDLTPDEKKALMSILEGKGFTPSTFYLRFFQKGFSAWEIMGIKKCKSQFLKLTDVATVLSESVAPEGSGDLPGDKGYLYILAQSDAPGAFYQALKRANSRLCLKFHTYMNELGMSPSTTIKRFTSDAWKEWEVEGIVPLLENYLQTTEQSISNDN